MADTLRNARDFLGDVPITVNVLAPGPHDTPRSERRAPERTGGAFLARTTWR